MPPISVILAVLLACAYLGLVVFLLLTRASRRRRENVLRRLGGLATGEEAREEPLDIVKDERLSEMPWLAGRLMNSPQARRWAGFLRQADIDTSLGAFMMLSMLLGVLGALAGALWADSLFAGTLVGLCAGAGPALWARRRRAKRIERFEGQLPDALDLVARALKAGHTFPTGMSMVHQEFGEPIGPEFGKTLDEINFGMPIQEALDNLGGRVDCPDLKFFLVSVKIQNEIGGNLAEIVENIAGLIRERFKLKGRVRVLSSEGRVAAWVLCLMPPVVTLVINLINPGYLAPLFEPDGRPILYAAAALMGVGVLVLRNMVRIKV